jgi:hypothetical protein
LQFFVRVVKSFLSSEVRWRALTLFAVLVGLLFAISGLNVLNSFVGRDFMTAISHRDQAGFVRMAVLYLGVFAASALVAVFQRFAEERLGIVLQFGRERPVGRPSPRPQRLVDRLHPPHQRPRASSSSPSVAGLPRRRCSTAPNGETNQAIMGQTSASCREQGVVRAAGLLLPADFRSGSFILPKN